MKIPVLKLPVTDYINHPTEHPEEYIDEVTQLEPVAANVSVFSEETEVKYHKE
jgi:hypothetical protein